MNRRALIMIGILALSHLLSPAILAKTIVIVYPKFISGDKQFSAHNVDVELVGPGFSGRGNTGTIGNYVFQEVPDQFTGVLTVTDPGSGAFPFPETAVNTDIGGSKTYIVHSPDINVGVTGVVTANGTPLANVSMNGGETFEYGTRTDQNGVYRFYCQPYISMGVMPSDAGYDPAYYRIPGITEMKTNCDFSYGVVSISGYVRSSAGAGVSGVTMKVTGLSDLLTDANGYYRAIVPAGYTGSVTPQKTGYIFEPVKYSFTNLRSSQSQKNFIAYTNVTISGKITSVSSSTTGIERVLVTFSNQGSVYTDAKGMFSKQLPIGWSGNVSVTKSDFIFDPAKRTYSNLRANVKTANFTAYRMYQVSGYVQIYRAGVEKAVVTAQYNRPVAKTVTVETNREGYYSYKAPETSSGSITASAEGMRITPTQINVNSLRCRLDEQNFMADTDLPLIAGRIRINNAGLGSVRMTFAAASGAAKTCYSNRDGYYCMVLQQVDPVTGWSGTVTPNLSNFTFAPVLRSYAKVNDHQVNQDYVATSLFPTISGRVTFSGFGLKNIRIEAKSSNPSVATVNAYADAEGYYNISLTVDGWTGTATPFGSDAYDTVYRFKPANYSFSSVRTPQYNRDFSVDTPGLYISGTVRTRIDGALTSMAGVEICFSDNVTVTTDSKGFYIRSVLKGWSGSASARRDGYSFTPASRTYTKMSAPAIAQDYTGTPTTPMISGRITNSNNSGIGAVILNFVGVDGKTSRASTDIMGFYSKSVAHGWSGTVSPSKSGYYFNPAFRSYTNVSTSLAKQDYAGVSQADMNIFTGAGMWSNVARWSLKRLPKDGEPALIGGVCTMDVTLPLLSMLVIDKVSELGTNRTPTLDMKDRLIGKIPAIINRGTIRTECTSGMPFPAGRKLGGEIVFAYNGQYPPEMEPRQVIPPGIYNKIRLTGNKIVIVNNATAYVDELVIEVNSRFGDPTGVGGNLEICEFVE